MISVRKLKTLIPTQRRRKIALCLEILEKKLVLTLPTQEEKQSIIEFISLALEEPKLTVDAKENIEKLLLELSSLQKLENKIDETSEARLFLRACNETRHHLLAIIGTLPAEWDLISKDALEANPNVKNRPFIPGVFVYAEDIRSPFNLGSIFRTAEAFGAEKLILSPFCASPAHTRAIRSSMGTMEILPWEQMSLTDWLAKYKVENPEEDELPVMALETGGISIDEFSFPQRGIIVLGSEELGIQSDTLELATAGRISIPMIGSKASLNVGVAFGVLMSHWILSIKNK